MTADPPTSEFVLTDETRREIDGVVEAIARLATSDLAPRAFYAELLDRTVGVLAAFGGAVWIRRRSQLQLEHQINFLQLEGDLDGSAQRQHGRLIAEVLTTGEARLVPPRSGLLQEGEAGNPTDFLLILHPLTADREIVGVVEILQRPGASPAAQQGFLRFLAAVCELADDFHRHHRLCELQQRESQRQQFEHFSVAVHSSLDLQQTAYTIVSEGRQVIGCDRLSLAMLQGSNCRLLAISGVDRFDPRANAVRQLERLSSVVAAVDEPLWYSGGDSELPVQIDEPLQAYLDESHARMLAVVPLREPEVGASAGKPEVVGVLIAEQFDGRFDDAMRGRVDSLCDHCSLALRNARVHQSIPFRPVLRMIQEAGWFLRLRQLPKTAVALIVLLAVVIGLVAIPADFNIHARGELLPENRRDVFAPVTGVVEELPVKFEKQVERGEVVAVLHQPELDFEFRRVWGEMQVVEKQLANARARRLEDRDPRRSRSERAQRTTSEETELQERLNSLRQQYEILKQQQEQLSVRSPIAGRVLTWNLDQLLDTRPVERGQILMTVADLDGPWELALNIPEKHVGHVLEAQRESAAALDVSFVLATDPGLVHQGRLKEIALSTDTGETDLPGVLATVEIDEARLPRLRPGVTVTAKIQCGRRSLGYVWLHDLIEAVRARLLF